MPTVLRREFARTVSNFGRWSPKIEPFATKTKAKPDLAHFAGLAGMRNYLIILLVLFSGCPALSSIQDPFEFREPVARDESESPPSPLRIFAFDVGQGDATLVLGPTGRSLLIDGGPIDAGAETILPALSSLGLDHLNWIVATHYDADHIGGLPEVMRDLAPISGLLDRGDNTDKTTPTYEDYLETAAPYRHEAMPGQRLDLGDGSSAEVVVVNGRYKDGSAIHLNPDEENEASIGLVIRYGEFTYLSAGDLPGGGTPGGYETKDMETILGEIVGDIDILHVSHHGSSSSSNENFLDETRPEATIISVGVENNYGHPTDAVLSRLEAIDADIHRTDIEGDLEISTDGTSFTIRPLSSY